MWSKLKKRKTVKSPKILAITGNIREVNSPVKRDCHWINIHLYGIYKSMRTQKD